MEMIAPRWKTTSQPATARATAAPSRRSPATISTSASTSAGNWRNSPASPREL